MPFEPPLIGYEQSMEEKREVLPDKTNPARYWRPRKPRRVGDEEDYEDIGFTSQGRWGNAGSGILFTTGDHILLLKRSPYVEEPGTWGIPGGAVPQRSDGTFLDPYKSALRETREELGSVPAHDCVDEYVYDEPGFRYTTYLCRVDPKVVDTFVPTYNWENDRHAWVSLEELEHYDLHFGVVELLNRVNPFVTTR